MAQKARCFLTLLPLIFLSSGTEKGLLCGSSAPSITTVRQSCGDAALLSVSLCVCPEPVFANDRFSHERKMEIQKEGVSRTGTAVLLGRYCR